jgi:hypothetical protein
MPTEAVRGSSAVQSTIESDTMQRGTQGNAPVGTDIATSSMLSTSNPFASLDSLDDSSEQSTNEFNNYSEAPRMGGGHSA